MYPNPFFSYSRENHKHRALLDALIAWYYETRTPGTSEDRLSKFVPKHILGYLTYEDVEHSLIRLGMDPGNVCRTSIERHLGRFASVFHNDRDIIPGVSDGLVVEITLAILEDPQKHGPRFMRFYRAYTKLAPPPPILVYLHTLVFPLIYDLKKLCEEAMSNE